MFKKIDMHEEEDPNATVEIKCNLVDWRTGKEVARWTEMVTPEEAEARRIPRRTVNIDMAEVARLKQESEEMYERIYGRPHPLA